MQEVQGAGRCEEGVQGYSTAQRGARRASSAPQRDNMSTSTLSTPLPLLPLSPPPCRRKAPSTASPEPPPPTLPPAQSLSSFLVEARALWKQQDVKDRLHINAKYAFESRVTAARRKGEPPPPAPPDALVTVPSWAERTAERRELIQAAVKAATTSNISISALRQLIELTSQEAYADEAAVLVAMEKCNPFIFGQKDPKTGRSVLLMAATFRHAANEAVFDFALERTPELIIETSDAQGNNVFHALTLNPKGRLATLFTSIIGRFAAPDELTAIATNSQYLPMRVTKRAGATLTNPRLAAMLRAQNRMGQTPIMLLFQLRLINLFNADVPPSLRMLLHFADDETLFTKCDKNGRLPMHEVSPSNVHDDVVGHLLDRLEAAPQFCTFHVPPLPPKRKKVGANVERTDPIATAAITNSVFLVAILKVGCLFYAREIVDDYRRWPTLFQIYATESSCWRELGCSDLMARMLSTSSPQGLEIVMKYVRAAHDLGMLDDFLLQERDMFGTTIIDEMLFCSAMLEGDGAIELLIDTIEELEEKSTAPYLLRLVLDRIMFGPLTVGGCSCSEIVAATPFARYLRSPIVQIPIFRKLMCAVRRAYGRQSFPMLERALLREPDEHGDCAIQGVDASTLAMCIGALMPRLFRGLWPHLRRWPQPLTALETPVVAPVALHPAPAAIEAIVEAAEVVEMAEVVEAGEPQLQPPQPQLPPQQPQLPQPQQPKIPPPHSDLTPLGRVDTVMKVTDIATRTLAKHASPWGPRSSTSILIDDFPQVLFRSMRTWIFWQEKAGRDVTPYRERLEIFSVRYTARTMTSDVQDHTIKDRVAFVQRTKPWRCSAAAEANLKKLFLGARNYPSAIGTNRYPSRTASLYAPNASMHDLTIIRQFLVRVKAWRRWRRVRAWMDARSATFYLDRLAQQKHFAPPADGKQGGREFELSKAAVASLF